MPLPVLSATPTHAEVVGALQQAAHDYSGLVQKRAAGSLTDEDAALGKSLATFIREYDLVETGLRAGLHIIPPSAGPSAATGPAANSAPSSLGALVTEAQAYKDFAAVGKAGERTNVAVEMRGHHLHMFRTTIDSSSPGGGAFLPQAPQPIAPIVRQMRMFVRNLMNVQGTNLATIPYITEVSPASLEYSASAISEGSAKPEVAMSWTLNEATARKVAAWVPVTAEILDDATTLAGYIDGRLAYMLAVREEWELLNGSGTAPHLKGILQYSDLQTQAAVTGDVPATIGRAIGKVENVDGEADGVAMNPLDYWTALTTRFATQLDGGFVSAGLPFASVPPGLWGLPVARTRAIPQGTSIVGSWRLGATIFDRMETRIVVGNQHSDFFVNNKVAVLAEERLALAVHRPDFFVNAAIAFS